ncbi:unnamed protein product, partial [Mesorhabditis spiculigera]
MARVAKMVSRTVALFQRARRALESRWQNMEPREFSTLVFRLCLIISAILGGMAVYQRTINMWSMKNIGDTFLRKEIGSRQIVLGAFFREKSEQNLEGKYAIIHFLGDGRLEHPLYCHTPMANGETLTTRAHVQRIHRGKRAANDICAWAGHIAECEVEVHTHHEMRIGTSPDPLESMLIKPEIPIHTKKKAELVVCMAPMYIYVEWEILLLGLETWIAMGAEKIIVPVQSASTTAYAILKQYEKQGIVEIRDWPKWPVLSDVNPNGLVLSRGIEESHVNCLFYVKPFADMAVFTDIDDFYLPPDPSKVVPGGTPAAFRELFYEHPQAGSLLFEHRDVQLRLPEEAAKSLDTFNFDFLKSTNYKQNCAVWRMKTRVLVNASRVDSVNMHETGIHRFGYVQVRVPCRRGHFYHMRHSHRAVPNAAAIEMEPLMNILDGAWKTRLSTTLSEIASAPLSSSSTKSFEDFDKCMGAINEEHWTMSVSRCLTPHVCYSRVKRDVKCVAANTNYSFHFSASSASYIITSSNHTISEAESNCEAPQPTFTSGNHYYIP